MSFGFQFINNSDVVTLDSEFARMVVLDQGTYSPNSESNLRAVVSFSRTITSQEPPLVFARPTTQSGRAGITSVQIYGSPGAWTGFSIRTYSVNYLQPNGRWFVAAFDALDTSDYGMQLFDANGKLLFDSGNPCAVFTAFYQQWDFAFNQVLDIGSSNFFTTPKALNETDYMLINNYSMNIPTGGGSTLIGSLWDFTAGVLYSTTTSTTNPRGFYIPAIFARLAA